MLFRTFHIGCTAILVLHFTGFSPGIIWSGWCSRLPSPFSGRDLSPSDTGRQTTKGALRRLLFFPQRSGRDAFHQILFHCCHLRRHHVHALRQALDALQLGRPFRRTVECLPDGFLELRRQCRFSTSTGTPAGTRCSSATLRPSAVCAYRSSCRTSRSRGGSWQAAGVAVAAPRRNRTPAVWRRTGCRTGRSSNRHRPWPTARAPWRRHDRPGRRRSVRSSRPWRCPSTATRWCRFGGAARAIDAGAEELVEHVVLVGGQDQLGHRQAHHARWPAQMLPKLPEGTQKATCSSLTAWPRSSPLEVIDDLRRDPAPVDRIDGTDLVPGLEGMVVGDGLHDVPRHRTCR